MTRSPKLQHALDLIWSVAPHRRQLRITETATLMRDETARQIYAELLGRPLISEEADLLAELAQRLGHSVTWSHAELVAGEWLEWKEGRYGRENNNF